MNLGIVYLLSSKLFSKKFLVFYTILHQFIFLLMIYVILSKPLWAPEELSQFFPETIKNPLRAKKYLYDGSYVDGAFYNIFPFGKYALKLLQELVGDVFAYPLFLFLVGLILFLSFYFFLSIFVKTVAARLIASSFFCGTFATWNVLTYQTKFACLLLFLYSSIVAQSKYSQRLVSLFGLFFGLLFVGSLSNNIAYLSISILSSLVFNAWALKTKFSLPSRNYFYFLMTALLPVAAFSYRYYFELAQLEKLVVQSLTSENWQSPGNTWQVLTFGGIWYQSARVDGLPYTPWSPPAGNSFFYIQLCATLSVLVLISNTSYLQRYIKSCAWNFTPKTQSGIVYNSRVAALLIIYFLLANIPSSLNPAYYAPIPFGIMREPWAKFYIYFVLCFSVIIAQILEKFLNLFAEVSSGYLYSDGILDNAHKMRVALRNIQGVARSRFNKLIRIKILIISSLILFSFSYMLSVIGFGMTRTVHEVFPHYVNLSQHSEIFQETKESAEMYLRNPDDFRICLVMDTDYSAITANNLFRVALGATSLNTNRYAYRDIDFCDPAKIDKSSQIASCPPEHKRNFAFAVNVTCFERLATGSFLKILGTSNLKLNS